MSSMVETLKRSLTLSRDLLYRHTTCSEELAKVEQLLSLLSDRSALLWALLEEEAGEVVEVKPSVFHAHGDGSWIDTGFAIDGRVFAEILESGEGVDIETGVGSDNLRTADNARSMILCLARAIQEQRKREAGAQDA